MKQILTGDRPTGQLHLGHYVGSLKTRVEMQKGNIQTILIADYQALTDNMGDREKVKKNVIEVAKDYLAVGINPELTTICLQSQLPSIHELTMLYMNLVTVARLERNPTVKTEIKLRGFKTSIPAGFLMYPVSQAADITAFLATDVPVGQDQIAIIEQTNEIIDKMNSIIGGFIPNVKPILSDTPKLSSADGKGKMSKSNGGTIAFSSSDDEIKKFVMSMYTDSNHLKVSDPGQVEGNIVFEYLTAFDSNQDEVNQLKDDYRKGGLGDKVLKLRLIDVLTDFITPLRDKRNSLQNDYVRDIIAHGNKIAKDVTSNNVEEIKKRFGFFM